MHARANCNYRTVCRMQSPRKFFKDLKSNDEDKDFKLVLEDEDNNTALQGGVPSHDFHMFKICF